MEFKSPRVKAEYEALKDHNLALLAVLAVAERESRRLTGKAIVITMIQRSDAEQAALLDLRRQQGDKTAVAGTRSVHEVWRGADLRSWIYTEGQRNELCASINQRFIYGGRLLVAAYHGRGSAAHLHLQTPVGAKWEPAPWA